MATRSKIVQGWKKSNLSVPKKSIRVTSSPSPSTRLLDVLQRQLFALTNYLPKTLKPETEKSIEISLELTVRPWKWKWMPCKKGTPAYFQGLCLFKGGVTQMLFRMEPFCRSLLSLSQRTPIRPLASGKMFTGYSAGEYRIPKNREWRCFPKKVWNIKKNPSVSLSGSTFLTNNQLFKDQQN